MVKIDQLQKEVIENRRRKKQQANIKPDPFEQICDFFGLERVISESERIKWNTDEQRKKAEDMYGRKSRFNFIEELTELRRLRRQRQGHPKM